MIVKLKRKPITKIYQMKTYLFTLALVISVLSSCTAPQSASSGKYNDDIYTSSSDLAAEKESRRKEAEQAKQEKAEREKQIAAEQERQRAAQQANSPSETEDDYYVVKKSDTQTNTNSDGSVTNITNNYYDQPFDYNDYYDNEYSVRLRRFHNNIGAYGYYDDYYTNSYWYTGNPYNFGTSIYLGYNFWGPTYSAFSYNPSYYWYSNMGWGYDPWYNPYNGFGPYYGGGFYGYSNYGYNPYMGGYGAYNQGYWNGYNNGFYDGAFSNNYFNSFDNNSYYYGPRSTSGSNSRTTVQPTLAHRYMSAVESETKKPFEATKGRENNPYMNKAALESKPNTINRNEGTAKPAGTPNPGYKPAANDKYDSRENKPTNSSPRPVENNNIYNIKPSEQKPGNESKPYNQPQRVEPKQPKYEQPQIMEQQQVKPRNEQPKFEQPQQPRYEQPRMNTAPPQQAPSAPAPRNSGPRR